MTLHAKAQEVAMKAMVREAFCLLAGLALIGAPAAVRAVTANDEPAPVGAIDDSGRHIAVQEQNGNQFISGGVGTEERDALQAMKGRFNLELTMATPSGKYVGSTTLRIVSPEGKTVLDTQTDGPIFMAKLPPGQYTIQAEANGQKMTRTVSIGSGGTQQVTMTWPALEPARSGDVPEGDLPRQNMPGGNAPSQPMPGNQQPAD
jgi:hypothetical protein